RLWDAATGTLQQTLEGHSDWVSAVAFSPDGSQLASASHDTTVRLWDAATGTLQQTFKCEGIVYELSFSEEGSYLLTNRGAILTRSTPMDKVSRQLQTSSDIFVGNRWIRLREQNLFRLPYDYTPNKTAVRDKVIAIGCLSGRILMFQVTT
ncbi:WD40 repeat-like protein, partial [Lepidopterella palustris CBS 459.81]